ncbi:MAG: hypothetical protein ACT4P9_03195 [Betaproteobacteria bacterium]
MRTRSLFPVPVIAALAAAVLVLIPGPEPATTRFAPAARPPCGSCGVVEIVREIAPRRREPGGAPEGGVPRDVLGYRMGGGGGEGFVILLGAMAGATRPGGAGRVYEVDVRMEDGAVRTFRHMAEPHWRLGDRVRVIQGRIIGLS